MSDINCRKGGDFWATRTQYTIFAVLQLLLLFFSSGDPQKPMTRRVVLDEKRIPGKYLDAYDNDHPRSWRLGKINYQKP